MKLRDANLQVNEENSFTHPSSCILPSFSQNTSWLLLPKRLWKCASTISFRKYKRKVVFFVIYLFNSIHLSQLSSCWVWHLTFSWVQFLSNKLEFFVSCNIKITRTSFFLLCVLICAFLEKSNCSASWY